MSPLIGKRVIDLDISVDDVNSLVSDCHDLVAQRHLVAGLCQTLRSWEHLDIDWPDLLRTIYGASSELDRETLASLATVLTEVTTNDDYPMVSEKLQEVRDETGRVCGGGEGT